MTPAPEGWLRVIIRRRFPGVWLPHFVDNLGAWWNAKLEAWVLEPLSDRRYSREAGAWVDFRDAGAHLRAESALRSLGPEFTLEWQCAGPSQLPGGEEDVRPPVHTNPGWKTPKWEDGW